MSDNSFSLNPRTQRDECRILVFARPVERPTTGGLERRMNTFLRTGDSTEQLDSKQFSSLHGGGQIADYLLYGRRFIVEMKGVNGYPSARISRLINDELRREPRMFVFGGPMSVHRVLSERENGEEINRLMVNIGGRPVRKLLQQANPQISATRSKLQLSDAAGLAIILIDQPQMIEAGVAAYAVREALCAPEPQLDQIDFVWVSIESHTVRLPDGRLAHPELGIWRANRRPETDRAMIGQMFDAWGRFNGTELEHLDHTQGWESLSPVGMDGR